jgi:hypothetical protein
MFSARSRSYSERLNIKETDEHDKKAATTETIRSLSRGGGRGAGSRRSSNREARLLRNFLPKHQITTAECVSSAAFL